MSIESKPAARPDVAVVADARPAASKPRVSPLAIVVLAALALFAYFAFVFAPEDERQVFERSVHRRADTGAEMTIEEAPPGAMWDAWWYGEVKSAEKLVGDTDRAAAFFPLDPHIRAAPGKVRQIVGWR